MRYTRPALIRPIALAVAIGLSGSARGDIVVESGGFGTQSQTFTGVQRFGQSFTATPAEPVVGTVSFRWWAENVTLADPTITARLHAGAGFGGTVLATHTRIVPRTLPDNSWVDFVFPAAAALTAGQVYSLDFSLSNGGSAGGLKAILGDPYSGGTRLNSAGAPLASDDLFFRVLTVPGPGASAVAGMGMWVLARRRRGG